MGSPTRMTPHHAPRSLPSNCAHARHLRIGARLCLCVRAGSWPTPTHPVPLTRHTHIHIHIHIHTAAPAARAAPAAHTAIAHAGRARVCANQCQWRVPPTPAAPCVGRTSPSWTSRAPTRPLRRSRSTSVAQVRGGEAGGTESTSAGPGWHAHMQARNARGMRHSCWRSTARRAAPTPTHPHARTNHRVGLLLRDKPRRARAARGGRVCAAARGVCAPCRCDGCASRVCVCRSPHCCHACGCSVLPPLLLLTLTPLHSIRAPRPDHTRRGEAAAAGGREQPRLHALCRGDA